MAKPLVSLCKILGMVIALAAVVDAAAFTSAEKQNLVALVQSRQASDDDDSELSAPVVTVNVIHSSDIVDVLNDWMDKAQNSIGRNAPHGVKCSSQFRSAQAVPWP